MFAAFLGSAIRGITERLAGYDESLANVTKMQAEQADRLASALGMIESQAHQIRFLQERLDIARNERFAADQTIKRVAYEFQTAHNATLARLENQDALIRAQDEGIASIDKVQELQGDILHKYDKRIGELEFQVSKARAGHSPDGATPQHHYEFNEKRISDVQSEMQSRTEKLSDEANALMVRVSTLESSQLNHTEAIRSLTAFRNSAEHVEYREVADNAYDLARKLDQRVTDLVASFQYTGAPAEFVKYTHAADLAEIVRKLVRVELYSFDFSPQIDIAVRDAAIRALTNMTTDRRQFGSFTMSGNGSTTAFDSDGKPIHFDAN